MRKSLTLKIGLLLLVTYVGLIFIDNNRMIVSANIAPAHIYAVEDTTIIYMGTGGSKFMYEDGNLGYLDVGYQGSYGEPIEVQVLLKFNLPEVPEGFEVESANLYFPIIAGNLQGASSFSLKASSSLNHDWIQDTITTATLPAPISGSTIARSIATNAPAVKPVIGPYDFTSYVSEEIYQSNPRATFIFSGFTAEQAAAANIFFLDHYIQSTETHMGGNERPYLILTYSEIVNIEITGVTDGGLYNSNVTPHYNLGTAKLNGAPFTSGTMITNEGTYTLTVDSAGQTHTIQFTIDKTPPTATVVINNGSYFTNHQFVDVRITPDSGVNDIVSMRYSVNDSSISTTQSYYSQFSIGVGSANGDKSVRVQLIDAAGNISPLYFWDFSLNTTVPTGILTINSGATFTQEQEVDLLITPSTDANEIVNMRFSIDNNNWSLAESYNPSKRYKLPLGDGDKTVFVQLTDRFGNIGTIKGDILLDMTPPTASISFNGGKLYTNNTNVAVEITPDAGVNDIKFIKYAINDLTPTQIAYTNGFTIDVGNTNEEKNIKLTLIDAVGHESPEYSSTVTLDTEAPTGTVAINGGATHTTTTDVTLNFTLGTGVTDVVGVQFSNDNSTWTPEQAYGPSMSYTLPAGDGDKTIYVRLIDRAGNTGASVSSMITLVNRLVPPVPQPVPQPVVPEPAPSGPSPSNQFLVQRVMEKGEVHYLAALTLENIQTLLQQLANEDKREVRVLFPTEAAAVESTLDAQRAAVELLARQEIDLLIHLGNVTIRVPDTSLNGFPEDLFFRIVPVKSDVHEVIQENVQQNEQAQAVVGNKMTVKLLGKPVTIETNMQNRPVTITLPIPDDATEEQIASLLVYIEHSDGTTEVKSGRIVEFEPGAKGFEFEVDHFSTFSLIYASEVQEVEAKVNRLAPYIQGYPDGTFKPNAPVTRAQMSTMLARHLTNGDIPPTNVTFTDLGKSDAKDAIEFVKQAGLFNGTTQTTFDPNGTTTRAQMASVVVRWVEHACAENNAKDYCQETATGKIFSDVTASHWASSSIEKVTALGIMSGNSATTFNPNGTLTRAEAVKVLNQLFERPVVEGITELTFRDVPAGHWAIGDINAAATEMLKDKIQKICVVGKDSTVQLGRKATKLIWEPFLLNIVSS